MRHRGPQIRDDLHELLGGATFSTSIFDDSQWKPADQPSFCNPEAAAARPDHPIFWTVTYNSPTVLSTRPVS
jgi:hypothetical protein